MTDNYLSKKLRDLREKCGYTQQQIANTLNIDRSTYSYYETGKTSPDIPSLIVLANVFSVSIEELLGQDQQTPLALNDSGSPKKMSKLGKSFAKNDSHIYDLTKNEKQLICYFRASTPEIRKQILELINSKDEKE
ncbi:MAG TPA: helix-turn-helix domain-containing protein [Oscillospiraceae bacterium]|nr:helix-turn-helix domain-containing protein [Oscillospiraceae bacterium]